MTHDERLDCLRKIVDGVYPIGEPLSGRVEGPATPHGPLNQRLVFIASILLTLDLRIRNLEGLTGHLAPLGPSPEATRKADRIAEETGRLIEDAIRRYSEDLDTPGNDALAINAFLAKLEPCARQDLHRCMQAFGECYADIKRTAIRTSRGPTDSDSLEVVVWTRLRVYGFTPEGGPISMPLAPGNHATHYHDLTEVVV